MPRGSISVTCRTVECPRCGHLVHWRNCKAKANRRQPAELRDGDGCLGAKCGARNATAAERAAAMRRMCEALENGTRRLVAWPATADDTRTCGYDRRRRCVRFYDAWKRCMGSEDSRARDEGGIKPHRRTR